MHISLDQRVLGASKKNSILFYTAYIKVGAKQISLKKGTDYKLSSSVNQKSVKGEVVLTGKENYTGSKIGYTVFSDREKHRYYNSLSEKQKYNAFRDILFES